MAPLEVVPTVATTRQLAVPDLKKVTREDATYRQRTVRIQHLGPPSLLFEVLLLGVRNCP